MSHEQGGHFGGQYYTAPDMLPVPESVEQLYDPARMDALGQIAWPLSEEQLLLLAAMDVQGQYHVAEYEAGKIDTTGMKVSERFVEMSHDIDWEYYILAPLRDKDLGPKLAALGYTKENALDEGDTFLDTVSKLKDEMQPDWIKKRATVIEPKQSARHAAPRPDRVEQIGNVTEAAMEITGKAAKKAKEFVEDPENRKKIAAVVAVGAVSTGLLQKPVNEAARPAIAVVSQHEKGLVTAGAALGGQDKDEVTVQEASRNITNRAQEILEEAPKNQQHEFVDHMIDKAGKYFDHIANRKDSETSRLHDSVFEMVKAIVSSPHSVTPEDVAALSEGIKHYEHEYHLFVKRIHKMDQQGHLPHRAVHALAALLTLEAEASGKLHHQRTAHHKSVEVQTASSLPKQHELSKQQLKKPEHQIHHAKQQVHHKTLHKLVDNHEAVKKVLPNAAPETIQHNMPLLIEAMHQQGVDDIPMIAYTLATINAEDSGFLLDITEYDSGQQYEGRADLGNVDPGDGPRYKGRTPIQITGHNNYRYYGNRIGVDLEAHPELANHGDNPLKILAVFIADRQQHIRTALAENNLALARTYVNGGTNGLDRFTKAYNEATKLLQAYQRESLNEHGQEVCDSLGIPYLGIQDGYSGGVKQPVALCEIDGQPVNVDIAANVMQMFNDAKAAGINFTITYAFRSQEQQIQLREQDGCADTFTTPAEDCTVPTAIPGYSNHQTGLAFDLGVDGVEMSGTDSVAYQWLQQNAANYGLHNLPSEPWHWSVDGH